MIRDWEKWSAAQIIGAYESFPSREAFREGAKLSSLSREILKDNVSFSSHRKRHK